MKTPMHSLGAAAALFLGTAGAGHAQVFDSGLPAGWQCAG